MLKVSTSMLLRCISLSTIAVFFSINPALATKPWPQSKAQPMIQADQLQPDRVMGRLGQPLGKIIIISGTVVSGTRSAKPNQANDLALKVIQVNGQTLTSPVTLPWTVFTTATVKPPKSNQAFKYVGYETGSFTGVPHEAFKVVPAVASREFHFESWFEVLQEELPIVQNQADFKQFLQQRVRLVGKYVVTRHKPDPMSVGNPGFQGDYLTAQIVLQDGSAIALESPLIKQSLRSEQEVQQYDRRSVEVVGRLETVPSPAKNQRSSLFIVPESISLSLR